MESRTLNRAGIPIRTVDIKPPASFIPARTTRTTQSPIPNRQRAASELRTSRLESSAPNPSLQPAIPPANT